MGFVFRRRGHGRLADARQALGILRRVARARRIRRERAFLGIDRFAEKVSALPDDPEAAIRQSLEALQIPEARWTDYLTRVLAQLSGWTGYIRWRGLNPDDLSQKGVPDRYRALPRLSGCSTKLSWWVSRPAASGVSTALCPLSRSTSKNTAMPISRQSAPTSLPCAETHGACFTWRNFWDSRPTPSAR